MLLFLRLLLLQGRLHRFAAAECELPIFFTRLISITPLAHANSLRALHGSARTCMLSWKIKHPCATRRIRSLSVYHAFTRTPSRNVVHKVVFFRFILLIGSWPFCHFDLEDRDLAGSVVSRMYRLRF